MIVSILLIILIACVLIYRHYFPPIPKLKDTPYDYGLLLGCPSHDDGSYSTSQIKRCTLAMDAFKQNRFKTLVITGGAVKNEYVEAEQMKKYILQRMEMPIITETRARNSFENFTYAKEIIQDGSVLILSSDTHIRRACAIARQFFKDYSALGYPHHKWKHIYREAISRFVYIKIEILKKFNLYK
ncbi:MAG: YdcF family protein [Faecalicoccus sp.]|nr:YdcF family protein [Faecalicoccus sp.]